MIADQMRKIFAFNNWAWQHTFASIEQLGNEEYHVPRLLFEGSIHNTLVHCLSAESIWLSRCEGISPDSMFDPQQFSDFSAVRAAWQPLTLKWTSYVQSLSDDHCAQIVEYRNTRGNGFSLQLVDILQHVVNHATEHRSQLTPILYNLDVPTQPLDYMRFQLRP